MIGIICALSIEVEELTKLLSNKEENTYAKMKYISGTINGKEVVMTECGIGKVNAAMSTQVMIDHYNPDVIINSGIAGSVSKTLNLSKVIILFAIIKSSYKNNIYTGFYTVSFSNKTNRQAQKQFAKICSFYR
mgnify:CR=1 FL=1